MDKNKRPEEFNINLDTTPIYYSDNTNMVANPDGVVFNFSQRVINTNQLRVVTRVGMSRDHAKRLASELGKLLALTDGQVRVGEKN